MSSAPPAASARAAGLRKALLDPASVALVGASDSPGSPAARPLAYLRSGGFGGAVYPVNPTRETVGGERSWPTLRGLPGRPDHVFLMTGTGRVAAAVRECVELEVPVVTVLASGFAESGDVGRGRQAQLTRLVEGSHTRLLGPSSLGVVNPRNGLTLTGNAAFNGGGGPAGRVLVVSHSGSLIGGIHSRARARSIGFAGLVSVGAEADLSIGEICAATLDDDEVDGYLLFLETLRHAPALRSFAVAAEARGKPIVAYSLGRSREAAELAQTHTGALASEADVTAAFLRDCGIAQVESFDTLFEAGPLLDRLPISATPPRVGIVTTTGGGGAMLVDQLALRGVPVCRPGEATAAALRARGIEVTGGALIDLTLAGTRPDVMEGALRILAAAPELDLVVAVVGSSARLDPNLAVRPIVDAKDAGHPLAAFVVPDAPDALRLLADGGVASFAHPETCADAVAAAMRRRSPVAAPAQAQRPPDDRPPTTLDEVESYDVLTRVGVPLAPTVVVGIDRPLPDPMPFTYPVVAKAVSRALPHKTDAGAVVVGLSDPTELAGAITQICSRVAARAPDVHVRSIVVQPMLTSVAEVLVGYRDDAQVGPIVLLAAGGQLAEIHRDRSIRLAPVDESTARSMIDDVRALRVLHGYRGASRGDIAALTKAIVAVSRLVEQPDVLEAEINPLLVRAEGVGVVAVDALVRLR